MNIFNKSGTEHMQQRTDRIEQYMGDVGNDGSYNNYSDSIAEQQ